MIIYFAAGYSLVGVCTFMALEVAHEIKCQNKKKVLAEHFRHLFCAVFWPPFWLTYAMVRFFV
jgi:hypothetical protein